MTAYPKPHGIEARSRRTADTSWEVLERCDVKVTEDQWDHIMNVLEGPEPDMSRFLMAMQEYYRYDR